MSKSLPNPWIRANFIDILKPSTEAAKKKPFKNPAKIVQVINANDENRVLFINDKENIIAAFLTASVVEELEGGAHGHKELGDDDDNSFSLKALKNSFVKLEEYHYTTVLQTAGSRDVKTFSGLNIDLPLAIQATRIALLAGHFTEVVGAPVSINKDPRVKEILNTFKYATLVDSLATRQFPNKNQLPNDEGLFLLPPNYCHEYPILLSHCVISAPQRQILDSIDTFDHSQIIKLQAEKKVKAKKSKATRSSTTGIDNNTPLVPLPEAIPVAEPTLAFAGSEETMTQLLDAVERAKDPQRELSSVATRNNGGSARSKVMTIKAAAPQSVDVSTQDFLLTQDHLHELADILDSQVLLTQQFISSPAKAASVPVAACSQEARKPNAVSASTKVSSSSSGSSSNQKATSVLISSQDDYLTQEQIPLQSSSSSSSSSGLYQSVNSINRNKIGSKIAKNFPSHGWHEGEVLDYDHPTRQFYVRYLDGDAESIDADEIQQYMNDFIHQQASESAQNLDKTGTNGSPVPVKHPPKQNVPRPMSRMFKKASASLEPVGDAPSVQLSLDKNIRKNLESIKENSHVNVPITIVPPMVPMPIISENIVPFAKMSRKAVSPAKPAAEIAKKRRLEAVSSRHVSSPETLSLLTYKISHQSGGLPLSPIAAAPLSPWVQSTESRVISHTLATPTPSVCPRPLRRSTLSAVPAPKLKAKGEN